MQSPLRSAGGRIVPLVSNIFNVPDSILRFEAACFGNSDWSLRNLQKAGDEKVNSAFAAQLGSALSGLSAKRAFAPNPTEFNAAYIAPEHLQYEIILPGPVRLYRNKERPADATLLERPGDAGIFSAGGCGVIVVTLGNKMIFAHSGRESLIDRTWVKTKGATSGRARPSVVDNIMHTLGAWDNTALAKRVHVWPLFFIKRDNFYHPFNAESKEHADYNKAAAEMLTKEYGRVCVQEDKEGVAIDLALIAHAQFMRYGVQSRHIHMEHSSLDEALPTTRNGGGRYLVAIVRH